VFVVLGWCTGCDQPAPLEASEGALGTLSAVPNTDFNGDGAPDLVYHNGTTGRTRIEHTLWLGAEGLDIRSEVELDPSLDVPDSTNWKPQGIADFDRDGRPDLLWHQGVTGETQVWFMNDAARIGFTMLSAGSGGGNVNGMTDASGWLLAGTGDFNRDGIPDILWHNRNSGATVIWHMNVLNRPRRFIRIDSAPFATSLNLPDSSGWRLAAINDFDGDGNLDIVWRNAASNSVSVWHMSDATFLYSSAVIADYSPSGNQDLVATADFDRDGKRDLMWLNRDTRELFLWSLPTDGASLPLGTESYPVPRLYPRVSERIVNR
jgi:hypothetical protein